MRTFGAQRSQRRKNEYKCYLCWFITRLSTVATDDDTLKNACRLRTTTLHELRGFPPDSRLRLCINAPTQFACRPATMHIIRAFRSVQELQPNKQRCNDRTRLMHNKTGSERWVRKLGHKTGCDHPGAARSTFTFCSTMEIREEACTYKTQVSLVSAVL